MGLTDADVLINGVMDRVKVSDSDEDGDADDDIVRDVVCVGGDVPVSDGEDDGVTDGRERDEVTVTSVLKELVHESENECVCAENETSRLNVCVGVRLTDSETDFSDVGVEVLVSVAVVFGEFVNVANVENELDGVGVRFEIVLEDA